MVFEIIKNIQGISGISGKIFFKKVKVIPEVNFNEEFNGDLHFDIEVDLHGFFNVNFVFLNRNPLFLHLQSIERKILHSRSIRGYLKLTKFSKRSVSMRNSLVSSVLILVTAF